MRVLVGCETSGIVRDAFLAKGHDAISCDLLPTEREGPHYQGDIFDILYEEWDLAIFHPPCTDLAVSGAAHFAAKRADGRQQRALDFVRALLDAPIERIALENPVSIISSQIRKPDQIIQPYQFGHDASKKTCLWLKNLPLLVPTHFIEPRIVDGKPRWGNQTDSGQNKLSPSPTRGKQRGKTYEGIAQGMAEAWG